jgi:hypothetical protein
MRAVQRVFIVYNADSDLWSLLVDVARKLAGRDECALCTLTHGSTGERSAWKACKQSLGVPVEAVHRDELSDGLRGLGPLPFVAVDAGGGPELLLDRGAVLSLGGKTDRLEQAMRDAAHARGMTFQEDL